jgi:hypothetical protein
MHERRVRPRRSDSTERVSGEPGVVHPLLWHIPCFLPGRMPQAPNPVRGLRVPNGGSL